LFTPAAVCLRVTSLPGIKELNIVGFSELGRWQWTKTVRSASTTEKGKGFQLSPIGPFGLSM